MAVYTRLKRHASAYSSVWRWLFKFPLLFNGTKCTGFMKTATSVSSHMCKHINELLQMWCRETNRKISDLESEFHVHSVNSFLLTKASSLLRWLWFLYMNTWRLSYLSLSEKSYISDKCVSWLLRKQVFSCLSFICETDHSKVWY